MAYTDCDINITSGGEGTHKKIVTFKEARTGSQGKYVYINAVNESGLKATWEIMRRGAEQNQSIAFMARYDVNGNFAETLNIPTGNILSTSIPYDGGYLRIVMKSNIVPMYIRNTEIQSGSAGGVAKYSIDYLDTSNPENLGNPDKINLNKLVYIPSLNSVVTQKEFDNFGEYEGYLEIIVGIGSSNRNNTEDIYFGLNLSPNSTFNRAFFWDIVCRQKSQYGSLFFSPPTTSITGLTAEANLVADRNWNSYESSKDFMSNLWKANAKGGINTEYFVVSEGNATPSTNGSVINKITFNKSIDYGRSTILRVDSSTTNKLTVGKKYKGDISYIVTSNNSSDTTTPQYIIYCGQQLQTPIADSVKITIGEQVNFSYTFTYREGDGAYGIFIVNQFKGTIDILNASLVEVAESSTLSNILLLSDSEINTENNHLDFSNDVSEK